MTFGGVFKNRPQKSSELDVWRRLVEKYPPKVQFPSPLGKISKKLLTKVVSTKLVETMVKKTTSKSLLFMNFREGFQELPQNPLKKL